MKKTKHAQKRFQQRGIAPCIEEYALVFGTTKHRQGKNSAEIILTSKDYHEFRHYISKLCSDMEKMIGRKIITDQSISTIITGY